MTDETSRWRALDVAVNEVQVAGVQATGDGSIDVLLHANALPTDGLSTPTRGGSCA